MSSFGSALRWEAIHAWSTGRALSRWSAAELPREAVARRIVGVAAMGVPAGVRCPVADVMIAEPYESARPVFWIVDNGTVHRGETAVTCRTS